MSLFVRFFWGTVVLLSLGLFPGRTSAQVETGALCVATFADLNGNGIQDENEVTLPGVNINLATGGVIIATHIMTAEDTPYCFEYMLPGIYMLTFTDSPMYRATTPAEGTFFLEAGQRLTVNAFGAFPIPPANLRSEVAAQVAAEQEPGKPLSMSTRMLLAMGSSMGVMVFMIGIGAVVLGTLGLRRQAKPREAEAIMHPPEIIPPPQ